MAINTEIKELLTHYADDLENMGKGIDNLRAQLKEAQESNESLRGSLEEWKADFYANVERAEAAEAQVSEWMRRHQEEMAKNVELEAKCAELEAIVPANAWAYKEENDILRAKVEAMEKVVDAAEYTKEHVLQHDDYYNGNAWQECACKLCKSLSEYREVTK